MTSDSEFEKHNALHSNAQMPIQYDEMDLFFYAIPKPALSEPHNGIVKLAPPEYTQGLQGSCRHFSTQCKAQYCTANDGLIELTLLLEYLSCLST